MTQSEQFTLEYMKFMLRTMPHLCRVQCGLLNRAQHGVNDPPVKDLLRDQYALEAEAKLLIDRAESTFVVDNKAG